MMYSKISGVTAKKQVWDELFQRKTSLKYGMGSQYKKGKKLQVGGGTKLDNSMNSNHN